MAELNWSDAQWQKVNDAVNEAFGKASVASAFLPLYGPLSGSAEIVRNERLKEDRDATSRRTTISLDTDHRGVNLKLINLTVNVQLSSEQVADETLSNALLAFRRAANILAQEEDRIVFAGFRRGPRRDDSEFVVNAVEAQRGLADRPTRRQRFADLKETNGNPVDLANTKDLRVIGQLVVTAVVNAIRELEESSNPAPFACVLGNFLFNKVHEPSESLVLPADRITPLLKGGPLLRSGKMDDNAGIIVSLAGNAVDIVVGTPPTVQFLQRTEAAKFLFRVYERFVLRIRDEEKPPVAGFRIRPTTEKADLIREATALVALADATRATAEAELQKLQ